MITLNKSIFILFICLLIGYCYYSDYSIFETIFEYVFIGLDFVANEVPHQTIAV